jgi:hypothetical protein
LGKSNTRGNGCYIKKHETLGRNLKESNMNEINENEEDAFCEAEYREQKRHERNRARREQNQILRDLCGTSARAAREDMGL